jgi:hypothetical protein
MLVESILNADDDDKSITAHLGLGTGARNDTVGHTHSSWFEYDDGNLYLIIKARDGCRKDSEYDVCGECRHGGYDHFEPKTPSGVRRILISNTWTNHAAGGRTGEEQYFGLRDHVEDYFALNGTFGHDMITTRDGPGVGPSTANEWLRDIAAESDIKSFNRRAQLTMLLNPDVDEDADKTEAEAINEKITDYGTDDDGNQIPDITMHDLRATYCTQLMRNEVPPPKAITNTGHSDPDSLKPYVMFAQSEFSAEEENTWF